MEENQLQVVKSTWEKRDWDTLLDRKDIDWLISQAEKAERLEETVRIYKVSDEYVKEQSKKVKHLFPLENTVGYGQLCDKVLELTEDKSFFVKAYTEKIMGES
ncbi:hypothetical protein [Peribacillus loiseleuriae]|uniref:hypothetical protein n=1 Tax=Peribacillus loiseleuriae TaxID=1679170 RepID=UPI003D00E687